MGSDPKRGLIFCLWLGYLGKNGKKRCVITENEPVEPEKRLKDLDLVASAVIIQNYVNMTLAVLFFTIER